MWLKNVIFKGFYELNYCQTRVSTQIYTRREKIEVRKGPKYKLRGAWNPCFMYTTLRYFDVDTGQTNASPSVRLVWDPCFSAILLTWHCLTPLGITSSRARSRARAAGPLLRTTFLFTPSGKASNSGWSSRTFQIRSWKTEHILERKLVDGRTPMEKRRNSFSTSSPMGTDQRASCVCRNRFTVQRFSSTVSWWSKNICLFINRSMAMAREAVA